jgi:exosortase
VQSQIPSAPSRMAPVERKRWLVFGIWTFVTLAWAAPNVISVVRFALQNDDASHILLIPFLSLGLMYVERQTIFSRISTDYALPAVLGVACLALEVFSHYPPADWGESGALAIHVLALAFTWAAGFALCFGRSAVRSAKFSLLILLLAAPIPKPLLDNIIYFLQKGSADLTGAIFDSVGVPYLREGFVFHLSQVSIEVAKECSGIRSSMAVLILGLIAAHVCLRTTWRQVVFVLCSIAIMIVKNGVRIATLTLLSIHVDPSFLYGNLHHHGGVVFFLLGLLMLLPIMWLLMRGEQVKLRASTPKQSLGVTSAESEP